MVLGYEDHRQEGRGGDGSVTALPTYEECVDGREAAVGKKLRSAGLL
jgi:hypothetical protein